VKRLLLIPFALLLMAGAPDPGVHGGGQGAASNEAQDTDGDLLFDLIYCSDKSGAGGLQMVEDVQACADALDDTGPKLLALLPGSYEAGSCDAACETRVTNKGILQLPSETTLSCFPGAVLNGFNENDEDITTAVVTNDGHTTYTVSETQTGVHIDGCIIDGGLADTYDGSTYTNAGRIGAWIVGCNNCSVTDNLIRNTLHAGIQNAKTTNFLARGNHLYQTAAYGDLSGSIQQASLYTWTQNAVDSEYTVYEDNFIERSGGTAIQLRRDTLDDDINFSVIKDNIVTDAQFLDNAACVAADDPYGCCTGSGTGSCPISVCIKVRGATDTLIESNRCVNAGGFAMEPTATVYRDTITGSSSTRALSNVRTTINDLFIKNGHSTSSTGAVYLAQFNEDTHINGLTVDATRPTASGNQNCLNVTFPQRGLIMNDVRLSHCGMYGINQSDSDASGAYTWEEWHIDGLTIDGTDWAGKTSGGRFNGIVLNGAHNGLYWKNVKLMGSTEAEFQANQSITNSTFENWYIDSVDPGYRGAYAEAQAAAITCNSDYNDTWIVSIDASSASDCTFASGIGATPNACFCNGTSWANFSRTVHEAVEFGDGTVDHSGVRLLHWTVKNPTNNDSGTVTPAIILTDGAGYVLDDIACIDDSAATTTSGNDCLRFVSAGNGPGEFTGIRMTNVRSNLSNANGIAIDEGAGGDDLFSTEFAYLFHQGTANVAGGVVFAETDLCTNANGSTWIDTDGGDNTTRYVCEAGLWLPMAEP
jgi:hypothetical protein